MKLRVARYPCPVGLFLPGSWVVRPAGHQPNCACQPCMAHRALVMETEDWWTAYGPSELGQLAESADTTHDGADEGDAAVVGEQDAPVDGAGSEP